MTLPVSIQTPAGRTQFTLKIPRKTHHAEIVERLRRARNGLRSAKTRQGKAWMQSVLVTLIEK